MILLDNVRPFDEIVTLGCGFAIQLYFKYRCIQNVFGKNSFNYNLHIVNHCRQSRTYEIFQVRIGFIISQPN